MSKTKKLLTFAVGDRVSWESQAGGHSKKKTGTVIEVVAPNRTPKTMTSGVRARSTESYVVEVTHEVRRSTSAIKKLVQKKAERYYPIVANLKLVRRAAVTRAADEIAGRPDGYHKSAGAALLPDDHETKDESPFTMEARGPGDGTEITVPAGTIIETSGYDVESSNDASVN